MSQFRIKMVSKITNIPIDTIRNWEKRYAFLKPYIGKNGERLYSDQDIDLLKKITSLLKTGGRVSDIASRILNGESFDSIDDEKNKISNEVKLMIEDYYQYILAADLKKIDQIESLIEITVTFKNRIDFIYYPLLERIRQDLAKKNITLAQNHYSSGHILNKLRSFLSSSFFNHDLNSCSFICASPANSIYEGGLLTLACTMKLKGYNIYYLGSNIPSIELVSFSSRVQPAIITISIHDPNELNQIIEVFKDSPIPVCVGGIGVRLAEYQENIIGSIHLISYAGTTASEKLESVALEYLHEYRKKTD